MQFVLIHGGTFDDRYWDRVIPLLDLKATAIRQPGRSGFRDDDRERITQQDYRENVAAAVSAIDDDLILVAHSLGGISVGAGVEAAKDRVKHVVLISAAIPPEGVCVLDMRLKPNEASRAVSAGPIVEPQRDLLGYMDPRLSEADTDYAFSIAVAEPSGPVATPVVEGTDRIDAPITWIRLGADTVFSPSLQTSIAERVGARCIVDLDAGHLVMISRPNELAAILNEIAARVQA